MEMGWKLWVLCTDNIILHRSLVLFRVKARRISCLEVLDSVGGRDPLNVCGHTSPRGSTSHTHTRKKRVSFCLQVSD